MYLDTAVKIPDVKGKITLQKKGKTTYVQYEYDRIYLLVNGKLNSIKSGQYNSRESGQQFSTLDQGTDYTYSVRYCTEQYGRRNQVR